MKKIKDLKPGDVVYQISGAEVFCVKVECLCFKPDIEESYVDTTKSKFYLNANVIDGGCIRKVYGSLCISTDDLLQEIKDRTETEVKQAIDRFGKLMSEYNRVLGDK